MPRFIRGRRRLHLGWILVFKTERDENEFKYNNSRGKFHIVSDIL